LFCKHNWKKVHEETTESQIEHLHNIGLKTKSCNGFMTERKKIIILKCTKCGKLDKTIVSI